MSAREVALRLRKRRTVGKVNTDEGTIYVRGLSGSERAEWIEKVREHAERSLGDQLLLSMALCDEHGQPLFESREEAFQVVCDWDTQSVVTPAVREVLKLSGMAPRADEDAEKKSEASQS